MANVNTPAGLTPWQYRNGNAWNGMGRMYFIQQSDPNAYAIGDPVTFSGVGDANGVPGVVLATAGTNALCGCIVGAGGIVYGGPGADPTNLNTTVIPATKLKGYYVMVCDDPDVVFLVQEGGAGPTLTATSVTKNVNLLAGTNSGYLSGWQFNDASVGVGATQQLKLLGLAQFPPGNNTFGAFAKWYAVINNHVFSGGTAGV
jgi:hypothetical protein